MQELKGNDQTFTLPQTADLSNCTLGLAIPHTDQNVFMTLSVDRSKVTAFLTENQTADVKALLTDHRCKFVSPILNKRKKKIGEVYRYHSLMDGWPYFLRLVQGAYRFYYANRLTQPVTIHLGPMCWELESLIEGVSDAVGSWHVSETEFAIDFVGFDIKALYDFIVRHLFLKWRYGRLDLEYPTTLYLNNVRRAGTTGAKVYVKDTPSGPVVRIEVTRKRMFFWRRRIINLFQVMSMRPNEALRGLEFKVLDTDAIARRLQRQAVKGEMTMEYARRQAAKIRSVQNLRGINDAKDIARQLTGRSYIERHPFQEEFEQLLEGLTFSGEILWSLDHHGHLIPRSWDPEAALT